MQPDKFQGREFTFIVFDEADTMPTWNPDDPFTGEPRWLREKRTAEEAHAEARARDFEKKLRHALNYGYNYTQTSPVQRPPVKIGNYLIYYLGGPFNCTQEYFFDKKIPADREPFVKIGETVLAPNIRINGEPFNRPIETYKYLLVPIPPSETPFSEFPIFLGLFQES